MVYFKYKQQGRFTRKCIIIASASIEQTVEGGQVRVHASLIEASLSTV